MPQLVEVQFKGNRRQYYTAGDPDTLSLGDPVVVQAERGEDLGHVSALGTLAERKCAVGCSGCPAAGSPNATATILRSASAQDTHVSDELRKAEDDVRRKVMERVKAHDLPMKISDAEWQWDRKKLTVYFTADKRVDFRTLVRDLATLFRTRIELRQIGARDEAKRLDGVGRCGRQYCCSSWLPELRPVSLSLAKDQRLSLNPSQISGGCGRLLCCLRYEHEFYVTSRKRFPKEGKRLRTAMGTEQVQAVDIFRERVLLRSEDGTTRAVTLSALKEEVSGETTLTEPKTGADATPPEPERTADRITTLDAVEAVSPKRRRRRRGGRGRSGHGKRSPDQDTDRPSDEERDG